MAGERAVARSSGARLASALGLVSLAVVSLGPAGCLPRGEPPAGRQIVADRSAFLLSVVPPNGDGVLRALFLRSGKDDQHLDLWVAAVDPTGGPTAELKLSPDFSTDFEISYKPDVSSGGLQADAQGRLLLLSQNGLVRVDPVTGETLDLGPGDFATPSPSGHRLLISTFSQSGGQRLFDETDGTSTMLDSKHASFVGETVFYVTGAGDLTRLPPGGAPEVVATGVDDFQFLTDSGYRVTSQQTLLLTRPLSDTPPTADPLSGIPAAVRGSLFDTTTLGETPLPDGPLYQQFGVHASPDGRYLVASELSTDPSTFLGNTALVDTQAGTIEELPPVFQFAGWRPGHDELWASPYDPDPSGALSATSIFIKRPGEPLVQVPGLYLSGFNEDGTYWFSRGASFNAENSSDVAGLADDLTAPRFPIVPAGSTMLGAWTVGGGRLLTESEANLDSFREYFISLADPRTGDIRLVGERGYLAAVGQTHALGLYHASYLRGDLTDHDFGSGRTTVLAPEFAVSAVAEPQGSDPYPPGARVVYQYQARFESSWDGLWMTTVP